MIYLGGWELLEVCPTFGVALWITMNAKHNKQPGTRPDFEALAAATASGPGDPSDRGKRLSCDGIDYTFDCAGGTI